MIRRIFQIFVFLFMVLSLNLLTKKGAFADAAIDSPYGIGAYGEIIDQKSPTARLVEETSRKALLEEEKRRKRKTQGVMGKLATRIILMARGSIIL